jgi:hypothetical protein
MRLRYVEHSGTADILCPLTPGLSLSRNNPVGSGERTRPACCRRRPAVGLAFPIITHRLVIQSGTGEFAAGRRKPHAGGMCSPPPTAWTRLRLAITHISHPQEENPKGIPSLSPGLRAASYPGCEASKDSPTLKGLEHSTRPPEARQEPSPRCNPFRVGHVLGTQPRVARGSQPWAEGCNPFGIGKQMLCPCL